jgi:hypothetical protein
MRGLGRILLPVTLGTLLLGQSTFHKLFGAKGEPNGPSNKAPAKQADTAEIERLIAKLGSRAYGDRRSASKALTDLGPPALGALRKAATQNTDSEIRLRARQLVTVLENGLDQLAIDYRLYGLKLPPTDAPLVRWVAQDDPDEPKPARESYSLAFLLKPATSTSGPTLLRGGWDSTPVYGIKIKVVDPRHGSAKELAALVRGSVCASDDGIALAIQCKARGWDVLAREIFDHSLEQSRKDNCGPPRKILATLARAYWQIQVTESETPLATIAQKLKTVLAAVPELASQESRAFLTSLEAAVVPSKAKPGSVQALIDALVYVRSTEVQPFRGHKADPHYLKVVDLGFSAVPELIEHLDDTRLTRAQSEGFNNFMPYNYRVCHVVSDLLRGLAGRNLGKDWVRRKQGYAVEKTDARAWWQQAKKVGERAHLLANALRPAENLASPNEHILRVLIKKYPTDLPSVYRRLVDNYPELQSWGLADGVADSPLRATTKRQLFLYAACHKNLEHRRPALHQLKKLDPQSFVKLSVQTLNTLPRSPKKKYWGSPEAGFAHLVMETDNADVWDALAKAARRCDVGLRMELMEPMCYTYIGDRQKKQRLAFLAGFLDDATLRDVKTNPKMFKGPHAGSTFPRLEVRNLAAENIAHILKMPAHPRPSWTAEQWNQFRKQVRNELDRFWKRNDR